MIPYQEIKELFEKYDLTLLTPKEKYKGVNSNVLFTCNKHPHNGKLVATPESLIAKKDTICPICLYEKGKSPKPAPFVIMKETIESKHDYTVLSRHISTTGKKKTMVDFICNKHIEYGVQTKSWDSLARGTVENCEYCNGTTRNMDFVKKQLYSIFPNLEIMSQYEGQRKRITVRCTKHDYTWSPIAYQLKDGRGCPYCGREIISQKRRIGPKELRKRLEEKHPELVVLSDPESTHGKVTCKCKSCGGVWTAEYANMMNPNLYTSCPYCRLSKGQREIKAWLDKNHVNYVSQKKFEDLKDKRALPFDFYLPDFNCCIEYQGIQHYQAVEHFGSDNTFSVRKKHDNMKKEYCEKNGIKLLEIKYTEFKNLNNILADNFLIA